MQYEVKIEGLDAQLKELRKFAPNLYKEMQTEIRPALKQITDRAKGYLPNEIIGLRTGFMREGEAKSKTSKTRGFPHYNPLMARKGIGYSMGRKRTNRQGWTSLYSVFNRNAAAMIIELAGSKNPGGRPTSHKIMVGKRIGIQVTSSKDSLSNNPLAGVHFINAISSAVGGFYRVDTKSKRKGRVLFRAVYEDSDIANFRIEQAIGRTIMKYQAGLPTLKQVA